MADTPEPQPVQSTMSLANLFAMPLKALVDADAYTAQSFAQFVQTYGFEADPKGGARKLRMVSFSYRTTNMQGQIQNMLLEVPLLSLIPLPSLSIQDAQITFGVEVIGALADPTALRTQPMADSATDDSRMMVRMARGTSGPGPDPTPTSRTDMHVTINIKQSDLPDGILQLLNRMSQSTLVMDAQPMIRVDAGGGGLTVGESLPVTLTLIDPLGNPVANGQIALSCDQPKLLYLPEMLYTTDEGVAAFAVTLLSNSIPRETVITVTATVSQPFTYVQRFALRALPRDVR
jgi:Protein of unknown function (DUF2589)